ncbi:MAG TPA: hypothetical protein VGV60_02435 [Candidatus Polarisedimenticolia bacterium]|nr:hypothetical protein [Candidatus Polarisedimenticolia bacterium]
MRSKGPAGVRGVAAWLPLWAALGLLPAGPVRAQDAAPASEGHLLVLNKNDDTLMVFDVPSYEKLATIPVGKEPHEVAATPDGRKAYVSNMKDKSVSVVDLKAGRVLRTLRPDRLDAPHGLVVTPDGRHLLVTSEGSRRLFVVDVSRDVVLRSVTTTQARPHMAVTLAGGKKACVTNVDSDSVTFLRIPELRVIRHMPVGDGPEGIAVTPNERWIVVALQGSDQVAILDAGSGAVLARLPTGRTPIRVGVTPNSFTALVPNRGSDDVTILDVLARRVKTTVRVGRRPGGVVTDLKGARAFICNNDSNTVSVLSTSSLEVTRTIPVGAHPDGIAFVPSRNEGRGAGPRSRTPGSSLRSP